MTDDVYCMGVDIAPAAAHRIVLALADHSLKAPLSRSLETWVKKKRAMSPQMVAVAYAGVLEAAAWANDAKRFAAALSLVDVADKADAIQSYCERSARRLTKSRPAFAKKLAALAESLSGK